MKKLLTFLLTALLAFGVGWAAETSVSYTFNSKSWGTEEGVSWTGTKEGNQFNSSNNPLGVQVTAGLSPITVTSPTSYNSISKVELYYASTKSAVGTISVSVDGTQIRSYNVQKSQTYTKLSYALGTPSSGKVSFTVNCTTNSIGIRQIIIYYDNGGGTTVAAPSFDPGDGTTFYGSQSVTITSSTSGATIYYTTNGSDPTTSSTPYTAPFTITATTTVKAIAVKDGVSSSVASATYTKGTVAAPTFNPDGGTFTGSTSVTITSTTPGVTIYYTTDGTDPVVSRNTQSIANGGSINLTESCTLKAMASINGENSSIVTSNTFTINQSSGGSGNFQLLTDATVLEAGDEIIFVSEGVSGSAQAMSTTQSNNNRPGTSVTVLNDLTVAATATTEVFTLEGGSAGWYFKTHDGKYIYAASSSNNHLKTEDAPDENNNAKATILIDNTSHEATVVFQGTYTRNNLRYNPNNGSPIYACYASTSTTAKPFIYYRSSSSTNPSLSANPNPVYINDDNSSGGKTGTFTVTGSNLGSGNVGVTRKHNFKPVLSATVGTATNHDVVGNQYWYFTPDPSIENGKLNGSVAVTYEGHGLSATDTLTLANGSGVSTTVQVNYLYTGPIYVIGDVNGYAWNTNNGAQMTSDGNGVYSTTVSVQQSSDAGYISFTKQLGSNYAAGQFGPVSGGNWWYNDGLNGIYQPLDTLGNVHNIRIEPGTYTIYVNPATNEFKIERYVINVTISPEDGSTFTGNTISGTITDSPAGTIEWSSDGTTWQTYTDGFTLTANQVGDYVTVYARSTSNGVTSNPVSATYQRVAAPAPEPPVFSRPGGAVAAGTVVTITAPEGCTLYVDGQQVTNPYQVTINSATTISAYCVNDEGTSSQPVSYTFSISTVCEAEVVFNDNGSDSSTPITATSIADYYAAGAGYIDNVTDIDRVYKGATGLKFASSNYGGSITFNLDDVVDPWEVAHVILNVCCYNPELLIDYQPTFTVTTSNGQSQSTPKVTSSTLGSYTLDFNGSAITSITISSDYRAYLKGFTIVYDCAPEVAAPVITPATGTYYDNQTVHISAGDGCTIYYTTNGTDPTTSSPVFTDDFIVSHNAGSTTTVKAIAVDGQGNISDVTSVDYTWGIPSVHIHPDSRNTTASSMTVTLTPNPSGVTVYYTTDGSTPTTSSSVYSGPFTVDIPNVGDQATVKAIAVLGGALSPVATATYTHVENVLDVHAPFFSPLVNHTYYGDQTLEIGCTTPNADIYYEIVEVSGTTAPSASSVEDPTHVSTYYNGTPIPMTVGNSYYVKAISYVGNNPSTVAEGWYTIEAAPTTQHTYTNLKDFNDNCPTGVTATFANPVQVVYHSTYTNNGEYAEFCYLRDNTDYACVYFGKRDTHDYEIFNMGDWIDGSQIAGVTNIWDRNFHIQLGTGSHEVTSWPSSAIGWSEILPEEMTNDVIVAGTAEGDNVWGHYVHLRNTTLRNVQDYSDSDPKHTGLINDGTSDAYYYDKFYRWSAGTCSYTTGGNTYTDVIHHLGDYDQAFFTQKQNDGATFDVYGIVDYYSQYEPPFELCPIDFLWAYKPVISLPSGSYTGTQTVTITATQPVWAAEGVVIYYKTDDMEEWAVYTGPITVNSNTHIQAYAEVAAEKTNGANYNDFVRSDIVEATYEFLGIEDPSIDPGSTVVEVPAGTTPEPIPVIVMDNNDNPNAVTVYTIDGTVPSANNGTVINEITTFDVTESTTVSAVSYLVVAEGDTLWSNVVTCTYEFIEANGKTYDLLTTNPVVGNVYVIVNKADKVGLSTTQNANNRAAIGVTFTDDNKTVVNGNTSLAEFVLESANAGRYYFRQVGTQNCLCVTTNANPNLMTGAADVNAEASATVNSNVTSGVDESYPATITFSYDGTSRYLRYYAGGRVFTTYGDATANQPIFLYGIAAPTVYDPAIDPHTQVVQVTTGDESLTVTVTPNSENPAGAVTYYTTDGSDPRTSSTRIEWNSENGEFPVNTTTTVKAVTGIEFADGMVWSNVVSETYTFAGVEPPTITPEGGLFPYNSTVEVTVTPNSENPDGAVTFYTTDGSDPRTSETATQWTSQNGTFPVDENTTVKAATRLIVDDVTLWSVVVDETYEFETPTLTPLSVIEDTGEQGKAYIVADELIGVWAVVRPELGINQLWAKDQAPYESIDKRPAKTDKQKDYMRDLLKYQTRVWGESNWVVLDFNNQDVTMSPEELVGAKIAAQSIVGIYANDKNYTIELTENPTPIEDAQVAVDYPGYQSGYLSNASNQGSKYSLAYNSYCPANFMTENLNRLDENGKVIGAKAGPNAVDGYKNDSLYFMNPKIQEVARLWAVWRGGDEFTVYTTDHQTVNAWDIRGAVKVLTWDYNCLIIDNDHVKQYGVPELEQNEPYEFHAAVVTLPTRLTASASPEQDSPLSTSYGIYPLDMSRGGNLTAVNDIMAGKVIESVRYYNITGVGSAEPFEGVNIVVTRYTDGSISTVKILK